MDQIEYGIIFKTSALGIKDAGCFGNDTIQIALGCNGDGFNDRQDFPVSLGLQSDREDFRTRVIELPGRVFICARESQPDDTKIFSPAPRLSQMNPVDPRKRESPMGVTHDDQVDARNLAGERVGGVLTRQLLAYRIPRTRIAFQTLMDDEDNGIGSFLLL